MTDELENIVREFNLAYWDQPKVQPLVAQIGWSHNLIVLQRCKDPLEREFYIRKAADTRTLVESEQR